MASYQENVSYTITNSEIQNCSGSGEQEGFIEQQFHEKCSKSKVVEELDCVTVKGLQVPVPLSCTPLGSGLGFEEQAEWSSVKHRTESTNVEIEIGQQQQQPTLGKYNKRKRTTVGTDGEIYFRLFKFLDGSEQYVLKMHDVQSDDTQSYHVILKNKGSANWSVELYDGEEICEDFIYLIEEDTSPPIFRKMYNLPLLERLHGWTLEKRKRGNGKEDKLEKRKSGNNIQDKFYYHQSRQFRSLVEVAGFLLYSCKPKDLKPLTSIMEGPPELREEEATTKMTMSLSSHVEASLFAENSKEKAPQHIVEEPERSAMEFPQLREAEKQCETESIKNNINACLLAENGEEKRPQNIVEEPQLSSFSSNAAANESKGTQHSERNNNEDLDIDLLQCLKNSFEEEETSEIELFRNQYNDYYWDLLNYNL